MKIRLTILSVVIAAVFSGTLMAYAYLSVFQGRSDGNNITIEWRTTQEVNVKNFVLERRAVNSTSYTALKTFNPQGDNSYYTYTDENAYKTDGRVYIYRLAIVDQDGSVNHSNDISISHEALSGVKRTWGSIKAMFR